MPFTSLPNLPSSERLAQLLDRRVEAVLVADAQRDALFLRFLDYLLRVLCGQGHRLLHQHMLAAADAVQRDSRMVAALGGNGAAVYLHFLERACW